MSAVVRPSGPLSPRVYWTRRVLMLAVLALLVWTLVRCVGGSEEPPPVDAGAGTPSTETPLTPSPDDQPRRRRQPAELPTGVRTVSAGFGPARQPCDDAAVSVRPQVPGRVRAGQPVPIQLQVSVATAAPCLLRLDSGALLVAVTSAGEPVWSSAGCESAVPVSTLVVQPHWSTLVEAMWSGRRGGEECAARRQVPAGDYTVQAAMVAGEPAAADFQLAEPREPEPRKPEPRDRDDDARGRSQT